MRSPTMQRFVSISRQRHYHVNVGRTEHYIINVCIVEGERDYKKRKRQLTICFMLLLFDLICFDASVIIVYRTFPFIIRQFSNITSRKNYVIY